MTTDSNLEHMGTLAGLRAAITGDDASAGTADLSAARAEFLQKLKAHNPPARSSVQRERMRRTWIYGTSLALAAAAVVIAYVWQNPSTTAPSAKTYSTIPGQRAEITLPDGTKINLNVATRVSVAEGFGKTHRTIDLDGEAQFTVTHDPKLSFTVKANGTVIRDLATVFAVRAYKGVTQTRIAVRDGKVSVQTPTLTAANAVAIAKNQAVEVAQDGLFNVTSIPATDDSYFAWTAGRLILRQQPLGKALPELSRWYGLEFRTGDPKLLAYNISAQLTQDFDMSDIQDIADIIGARAVRSGNAIVFYPRGTVK